LKKKKKRKKKKERERSKSENNEEGEHRITIIIINNNNEACNHGFAISNAKTERSLPVREKARARAIWYNVPMHTQVYRRSVCLQVNPEA
jgi:hypothetical protein